MRSTATHYVSMYNDSLIINRQSITEENHLELLCRCSLNISINHRDIAKHIGI